MPGDGGPAAAGQQAETVVEAGGDLFHGECPDPRRRELDGEGDAVEAAAELGDGPGILVGELEGRLDGPGPLDEEPDCIDVGQVARSNTRPRLGRGQRRDREDHLAADAERFPAGDDDPDRRARSQDGFRQLGAFRQDRIAVVEDEEDPLALHVVDDRGEERTTGRLGHAERAGDRRQDEITVRQRAALDDPGPIVEALEERPGQPQADPGLADAAGSGQGEEAGVVEDADRLFELALPADEAGDFELEVVSRRVRGPERRERLLEAGADDLRQMLRGIDRPKPVRPEVDEAERRAHLAGDEVAGRLRDEDLSTVAGRADAGRAMDVDADVPFGGAHRFSGVEAHPILDDRAIRPGVAGDRELGVDRGLDGLSRRREDEVQAVAGVPALEGAVAGEGVADEAMVVGEDLRVAVAERLEEPGRALDVGEGERDRAARRAPVEEAGLAGRGRR